MAAQGSVANFEPMMTIPAPNSTEHRANRGVLSRVWVTA